MNKKQIKKDIKTLNEEFLKLSGAWEYEDGGYGCIYIAEEELELVKAISSKYNFFKYNYNEEKFNKWSGYKEESFTEKDFEENNINESNYNKADEVAFNFKTKLINELKELLKQ